LIARISSLFAVVVAGYFGINPPGFVASVVALAFGLAASSFFPAIVMGIFSKRMNREGAITGMVAGLAITSYYIARFIALVVSMVTAPPPPEVQEIVENIRIPSGAGDAAEH